MLLKQQSMIFHPKIQTLVQVCGEWSNASRYVLDLEITDSSPAIIIVSGAVMDQAREISGLRQLCGPPRKI